MVTEQQVAELLEDSDWELARIDPGVRDGMVEIYIDHPVSPGLIVEVSENADEAELRRAILGMPSFEVFDGAPVGGHHRLLASLHGLAEGFAWGPEERRGLGFILRDHGLLDEEEAEWFAAEESVIRGPEQA